MLVGCPGAGKEDGRSPTKIRRGGEVVHDGAALQALAVQLERERNQRKWLVRKAGLHRDGEEAEPDELNQIGELVGESLASGGD